LTKDRDGCGPAGGLPARSRPPPPWAPRPATTGTAHAPC